MRDRFPKLMQGGLVLLLLVVVSLGGYSLLLSHRLELAQQQMREQQKTLAQQSGLISTLQTQDTVNRRLMADQAQKERQLRQQGEIYQRKYQDAIKNDECSRHDAPGGVLDLLRGTGTTIVSTNRSAAPGVSIPAM